MWEDQHERTHEPTPKRLLEAKKQGKAARSGDLQTFFILLFGFFLVFIFLSEHFMKYFFDYFNAIQSFAINDKSIAKIAQDNTRHLIGLLLPFSLLFAAAFLGAALLGGIRIHFPSIAPKANRINPINGFKRILSMNSFVELSKAIVKTILILGTCLLVISIKARHLVGIEQMPLKSALHQSLSIIEIAVSIILFTLALIAILDVVYQRWKYHRDLRMSEQEIREEAKGR